MPLFERGQILYKFCDLIDRDREEIANYMSCEMGKPILQSRAETTYAAEIGRANIEVGKHMYGEVLTDSSEGYEDHVVLVRHEALGVVAAVIPVQLSSRADPTEGRSGAVDGQYHDRQGFDHCAMLRKEADRPGT